MTYGSGNWAKHVATMEVREREPLIDTKTPYVSPNVLSSLSKASSIYFLLDFSVLYEILR